MHNKIKIHSCSHSVPQSDFPAAMKESDKKKNHVFLSQRQSHLMCPSFLLRDRIGQEIKPNDLFIIDITFCTNCYIYVI